MQYSEVKGDLFTADKSYVLAHCISSDFALGAGIAKTFRDKCNTKYDLISNYQCFWDGIGYCLFTQQTKEEWVVANLVTKFKYYNKPTYDSVKNALVDMKRQCLERGLCHIAMPQIACGLDGLSWSQIRRTIKDVFEVSNFEIVVYIR